jgi:hypothetical protein
MRTHARRAECWTADGHCHPQTRAFCSLPQRGKGTGERAASQGNLENSGHHVDIALVAVPCPQIGATRIEVPAQLPAFDFGTREPENAFHGVTIGPGQLRGGSRGSKPGAAGATGIRRQPSLWRPSRLMTAASMATTGSTPESGNWEPCRPRCGPSTRAERGRHGQSRGAQAYRRPFVRRPGT